MVDRPHKYRFSLFRCFDHAPLTLLLLQRSDCDVAASSLCPALYGFIPQTYCGDESAALCRAATGVNVVRGDGDPLDICILSTRAVTHGDILLQATPIGGFRMIDKNEADDKIIAVLKDDAGMSAWKELTDVPAPMVDMLK